MTARLGGIASVVVAAACAAVIAGCTGPPPALPTAVLDAGAEALSKDHPDMTERQLTACRDCHRVSDAPSR